MSMLDNESRKYIALRWLLISPFSVWLTHRSATSAGPIAQTVFGILIALFYAWLVGVPASWLKEWRRSRAQAAVLKEHLAGRAPSVVLDEKGRPVERDG